MFVIIFYWAGFSAQLHIIHSRILFILTLWKKKVFSFKIIDVDNIDFVNNPEDLGMIINRIDAELNGLF